MPSGQAPFGRVRTKRPPKKAPRKGRPQAEVDLERIRELRREGLDSITEIARALGIPRQTLTGPIHGAEVREAIEVGRVFAKLDALRRYRKAIAEKNGNLTGLLIFEMKQFGWTDRAHIEGTIEVNENVRERVREAIQALRTKSQTEGES